MRIDPDECRDPELLAAEVRRLRTVIAAGETTLTDAEREAIERAAFVSDQAGLEKSADTLRKILERTK
jgi:hypothetical protein